jgi:enoyl reductase-like protein
MRLMSQSAALCQLPELHRGNVDRRCIVCGYVAMLGRSNLDEPIRNSHTA